MNRTNISADVLLDKPENTLTNLHAIYTCDNGTIISSISITDGIADCIYADDEKHCTNSAAFGDCDFNLIDQMRQTKKHIYQNHANLTSNLKPHSGKACMKCQYEIIDRLENRSITCETDAHLQDCEDEQCNNGTIKCPQYYCIHIRYVCDGFWDCPFGYEEKQCIKSAKEGFFLAKMQQFSFYQRMFVIWC